MGWPSSIRYTKATRRGSVESRSNHERASPQALCPNLGGLHDVNVIRLSTLHEYAAVLHSPSVSICGDGDAPPSQLSLVRRGPQPCWPKAELQHWHLTATHTIYVLLARTCLSQPQSRKAGGQLTSRARLTRSMKIGSFPPGHGIEPEDASIATSSTLQLPTVVIQGVSQREQSTRYCQHVLVETHF